MSDYLLDQDYLLNVYKRLPLQISYGEGSFLYDEDGRKYLDMFAGIAVNALGYNHPAILNTLDSQGKNYLHLSNYFTSKPVIDLARLLVEHSHLSKVFFTNSGTEANEAAIKLARKYGRQISDSKIELISLSKGFHGRTMGSLSLTQNEKYQAPFAPLLSSVKTVLFNNVEDLTQKVSNHTCAVFVETLQGEGGIMSLSEAFIQTLSSLQKKYRFLVIADEIQSGIYRTGTFFHYLSTSLKPDIVTSAKAIGGGLPLGAMIVSDKLENILLLGEHESTFGGNPLSASLGKTLIEVLMEDSFQQDMKKNMNYFDELLNHLQEDYPSVISEVRGVGYMRGLEVGKYADNLKNKAITKGLLLNITSGSVLRLLPPLNISEDELNLFDSLLRETITELLEESK